MPAEPNSDSLIKSNVGVIRSSWRSLVLTDLAFKLIAFIVLTPLVGVLFRALLTLSGSSVVSDLDIVFLLLGPVGWICAISVGAISLGIMALEQASLMAIIGAKSAGNEVGVLGALRFAASNAWPVIQLALRFVAWMLLAMAPFLVALATVYFTLLTEYDINYYLKEKPPAFAVAVAIGVIIVAALVAVLLRLFTGWILSLPLVLFENVNPRDALRLSTERTSGHRRAVLCWIGGWMVVIVVLSMLVTGIVGLLGRMLIPDSTNSLRLLELTIGLMLLVWAIANLAVNLLSAITFAAAVFSLYRDFGREGVPGVSVVHSRVEETGGRRFEITRRRLFAMGVVGMVLAIGVGVIALRSVRLEDNVVIMAHRGSSKAAPENTMAAFRKAIEEGADWIELDVQETADGEVVVLHDSDFMKLAGQKLKIWDATKESLKEMDIGSWFAPQFKGERVPTLGEVLDVCKGRIRVNIELKYYGHDEQLERRVAEIVESRGMASEVAVMSLKMDGVKKMRSIRPEWKAGLLMSVAAGDLNKLPVDFLAVNAGFANRQMIRRAHTHGKEILVWTVNDAPTMSALISRGVDGLITDEPALARSVLEERARMSAPERLLLELSTLLGIVPQFSEQ